MTDWPTIFQKAAPRTSPDGLQTATLYLWNDEVREVIHQETTPDNRLYLHFRETPSCPHKSCVPADSPDLTLLTDQLHELAVEYLTHLLTEQLSSSPT